jgi:hypothetical protein
MGEDGGATIECDEEGCGGTASTRKLHKSKSCSEKSSLVFKTGIELRFLKKTDLKEQTRRCESYILSYEFAFKTEKRLHKKMK